MSKFDQVKSIVSNFSGSKKDLLDKICKELDISRANASVYIYKISKTASPAEAPVQVEVKLKKEKEPEKPKVFIDKPYTGTQILEFMKEMDERTANGYSVMTISEYFEMKKNLEVLL